MVFTVREIQAPKIYAIYVIRGEHHRRILQCASRDSKHGLCGQPPLPQKPVFDPRQYRSAMGAGIQGRRHAWGRCALFTSTLS